MCAHTTANVKCSVFACVFSELYRLSARSNPISKTFVKTNLINYRWNSIWNKIENPPSNTINMPYLCVRKKCNEALKVREEKLANLRSWNLRFSFCWKSGACQMWNYFAVRCTFDGFKTHTNEKDKQALARMHTLTQIVDRSIAILLHFNSMPKQNISYHSQFNGQFIKLREAFACICLVNRLPRHYGWKK